MNDSSAKREGFGSRLGFLLVSAGCAIGIGNVWRFPFVAGQNGGGLFVLFYLLFLALMGVPALTMELAIGRAARSSAYPAYQKLEPAGSKWHIHGLFCIAGCYILMMYYTTVCGWMFSYFFKFITGTFAHVSSSEAVTGIFNAMMANPLELGFWMVVSVVGGFAVVSVGLEKGVERVTKVMMGALFLLILVLAGHSFTLSDAGKGLSFYLIPNVSKAMEQGLGNIITAAMNQAFFTLSVGIGSMQIFGSYMSRDNTLTSESIRICVLDTIVAIAAGLIIFPACFSFGIEPDAGPSLIFITLPIVFINMAGGQIWGTLFFMFMSFASFSTVMAVFENIAANCIDIFGWSRKKAVWLNCVILLIGSLPCVLGCSVWSGLKIFGLGVLDFEDFIVSNLLLPLGSLVWVLFCSTKWGWGYENFLAETNTGKGMKLPSGKVFRFFIQFALPILFLFVFIQGLL